MTELTEEQKLRVGKLFHDRGLAKLVITIIDQTTPWTDPRKADAMEHYKGELAKIDAEITEITGTPPPVTVQLKTAKLFGESDLSVGGKHG